MSLLGTPGNFAQFVAAAPLLGWREVGVVAAGCAVLISFTFLIKRLKKPAAPRSRMLSPGDVPGVVRDVEAVLEELEKLSRKLHQRLDQKIARIETLLEVVDERLDGLSRAQRQARGLAIVDVTVDDGPQCEGGSPQSVGGGHEEIYKLSDSGIDALQIGRRVGRPVGEIELILSLRRTAQAALRP